MAGTNAHLPPTTAPGKLKKSILQIFLGSLSLQLASLLFLFQTPLSRPAGHLCLFPHRLGPQGFFQQQTKPLNRRLAVCLLAAMAFARLASCFSIRFFCASEK